ncbi:MAG: DUF2333 family protein, partial [Pseudomonadales bacterium]
MKLKFWQSADPIYMDDESNGGMSWLGRSLMGLLVVYLIGTVILSWWWDTEPEEFAVRENVAQMAQTNNHTLVTGYITTATFIRITQHHQHAEFPFRDIVHPHTGR